MQYAIHGNPLVLPSGPSLHTKASPAEACTCGAPLAPCRFYQIFPNHKCVRNIATLLNCPHSPDEVLNLNNGLCLPTQHLIIDCSEKHVKLCSLLAYYTPPPKVLDYRIPDSRDKDSLTDKPNTLSMVSDRLGLPEKGD